MISRKEWKLWIRLRKYNINLKIKIKFKSIHREIVILEFNRMESFFCNLMGKIQVSCIRLIWLHKKYSVIIKVNLEIEKSMISWLESLLIFMIKFFRIINKLIRQSWWIKKELFGAKEKMDIYFPSSLWLSQSKIYYRILHKYMLVSKGKLGSGKVRFWLLICRNK